MPWVSFAGDGRAVERRWVPSPGENPTLTQRKERVISRNATGGIKGQGGPLISLAGLAVVLTLIAAATLVQPTPAQAATSPIADGDEAALVGAINAANESVGPDTIELAPDGTYLLKELDNYHFGFNGLPAISSEITIEGHGAKIMRNNAPGFRLFYVFPNGK